MFCDAHSQNFSLDKLHEIILPFSFLFLVVEKSGKQQNACCSMHSIIVERSGILTPSFLSYFVRFCLLFLRKPQEQLPPRLILIPCSYSSSLLGQWQEVSPLTSGRLSHSSGPLNGGGSLSDSPPVSPCEMDDLKVLSSLQRSMLANSPWCVSSLPN